MNQSRETVLSVPVLPLLSYRGRHCCYSSNKLQVLAVPLVLQNGDNRLIAAAHAGRKVFLRHEDDHSFVGFEAIVRLLRRRGRVGKSSHVHTQLFVHVVGELDFGLGTGVASRIE